MSKELRSTQETFNEVELMVDREHRVLQAKGKKTPFKAWQGELLADLLPELYEEGQAQPFPRPEGENTSHGYRFRASKLSQTVHVVAMPREGGWKLLLRSAPQHTQVSWEKRLSFNGKVMKLLLDHTRDICFIVSPLFEVMHFNQRARETLRQQYQRDIQLGDDFWDFILPGREEDFLNYFNRALEDEVTQQREHRLHFPSEDSNWYESTFFPVRNQENQIFGVALLYHDIDALKQTQAEVEIHREKLAKVSYEQSHRIRRHVANLLGLSDMVPQADLPPEAQQWIQMMLLETQRLDGVIQEIVQQLDD